MRSYGAMGELRFAVSEEDPTTGKLTRLPDLVIPAVENTKGQAEMAIPKYRPCHTLGYCNYAEAVELADAIAKPELMFAGGVKSFRRAEENARIEPKDVDHTKNGIYIIRGMYAADPNPGADQQWCFRMLNGAAGMNCGIIIDWFRVRHSSSPGWVRWKLEQDANELAMYPDTTGE